MNRIIFTAILMITTLVHGASERYIAFFSAEQAQYRRILLDGVGNRHVSVELDSLGQCEIRIWKASEKSYVGLRNYTKGYLIPVHIRVDFPEKQLMSIKVYGTRFKEVVKFREVGSGLYIIDLYTQRLPQESIFRENTISALWPGGRFQPDISPEGGPVRLASSPQLSLSPSIFEKLAPYRFVVYRASFWAAAVSGTLIVMGLPLIIIRKRRKAHRLRLRADDLGAAAATASRANDMMRRNGALSFEEATLMADLERNSTD